MRLFDFSLFAGTDPFSPAIATADAVARYLDSADARGVITSLAGVFYDYKEGNRETLALTDQEQRLLSGFVVDPRRIESGFTDWDGVAGRYRAVVLFPALDAARFHRWPLSHPAVRAIFANADKISLPILVHVARSGDATSLAALAREVAVPVVAMGLAYSAVNEVITGTADCPNLLFGIRLFAGMDNIEQLSEHLGAERLVYDSGEALYSHRAPFRNLMESRINEKARECIATGNARRIFGDID